MSPFIIFLLSIAAVMTATGQLLMKRGSQTLGNILNPSQNFLEKIFKIVFEPHVFFALTLYFAGLFLWLKILSKSELSRVYPAFISVTVLLTSVASVLLFHESLTVFKIIGAAFIIIGLIFLLRVS